MSATRKARRAVPFDVVARFDGRSVNQTLATSATTTPVNMVSTTASKKPYSGASSCA